MFGHRPIQWIELGIIQVGLEHLALQTVNEQRFGRSAKEVEHTQMGAHKAALILG